MGLHLHRADRTDVLATGLGALLSNPLPDPFAEELVLVSARGMERWLSQRLSHVLGRGEAADGVCAGVVFRSPASLIAELTGTVDDDPWSPDAMTWPLLETIDASLDQPWCQPIAAHLGHFAVGEEQELRQARRYAVARRLAGLFASYARQRPELQERWLAGDDAGVPTDLRWQPDLWRALVARRTVDPPHVRHRKTVERLQDSPTDLPSRLSLFGHTRLPVTDIDLLCQLATHHDLHLWLPHPSDSLWRASAGARGVIPRREDKGHRDVGHPLFSTLGRDLRELQRSLPADVASDEYLPGEVHAPTLLGWLQSDIAANAVAPQGRTLAADDRSVQIHSCHSPARQIDVLREVLVGLLADDPTLEPRDILVMCPDIETYAPLIVAGFGLADVSYAGHPAHRLRVRLADRALTQTNPLLGVIAQLLTLAGGRATASEVINIAHAQPIRNRFAFSDDDLVAITDMVRQSNVRWGFDKEYRDEYGLHGVLHNTWRFGLDRMLVGVAMSEDANAWLGHTLPLDDVSSNRIELTGRFAEFVDRLQQVVDTLCGEQSLRKWLAALTDGLDALTRTFTADAWQDGEVHREFGRILADAGPRDDTTLRLADVRALLERRLTGRPSRANFRTGTLTVCTMVPMRSVPHRVVCLVGLDDGVFPRQGATDGDDALARDPLTGERDIRSEDRQLLLDAINAASDTVVVTYTGFSDSSGQHRPPSVPLLELLDALDGTTSEPVRKRVITGHPLQPFDVRNVEKGALGVPGQPFTFDATVPAAARAAVGDRPAAPTFEPREPLQAPALTEVTVDDLVAFFKNPVKGFFRALEYTLPWDVDGVKDDIPVGLDSLEKWGVGQRLLDDLLDEIPADRAAHMEFRRGTVPPGKLGWTQVDAVLAQSDPIAKAAARHRSGDPRPYDVDVALQPGLRLVGTVSPVYFDGLVSATYSKLGPKHVVEAWIRLLALKAAAPEEDWTACYFGRGRNARYPVTDRSLTAPADPLVSLRELVALYDAGRREPLPLPLKASYAWANARRNERDPRDAADKEWSSDYGAKEHAEPAHVRVWGEFAPVDVLLGPPRAGEEFDGEDTRLGALAMRLWQPLFVAEGP